MKILFTLLLTVVTLQVYGQSFLLEGTIVDAKDNSVLPGASVLLIRLPDSIQSVVISNVTGKFAFQSNPGRYHLKISFLRYQTL